MVCLSGHRCRLLIFVILAALCTTDAKLVSQYLVVEHMAAHYKKLNEAKCMYLLFGEAVVHENRSHFAC